MAVYLIPDIGLVNDDESGNVVLLNCGLYAEQSAAAGGVTTHAVTSSGLASAPAVIASSHLKIATLAATLDGASNVIDLSALKIISNALLMTSGQLNIAAQSTKVSFVGVTSLTQQSDGVDATLTRIASSVQFAISNMVADSSSISISGVKVANTVSSDIQSGQSDQSGESTKAIISSSSMAPAGGLIDGTLIKASTGVHVVTSSSMVSLPPSLGSVSVKVSVSDVAMIQDPSELSGSGVREMSGSADMTQPTDDIGITALKTINANSDIQSSNSRIILVEVSNGNDPVVKSSILKEVLTEVISEVIEEV